MLYEYAEKYTNTVGDRRKKVLILLKIKFQIIMTNLSVRGFSAVIKISTQTQYSIKWTRAQFHNTLIRLRFNPIYFMQNYTYFKQCYQEC